MSTPNTTTTVAPTTTTAPGTTEPPEQFPNATYGFNYPAPNFAAAGRGQAYEYSVEFDAGTIFAIAMLLMVAIGFGVVLMLFQRNHKVVEARRRRHAEMLAISEAQELQRSTSPRAASPPSSPRLEGVHDTFEEHRQGPSAHNPINGYQRGGEDRSRTLGIAASSSAAMYADDPDGLGPSPSSAYDAPRDYPASGIAMYRQSSYVPADPAKVRDILDDVDL
jgi:hypothetical protein